MRETTDSAVNSPEVRVEVEEEEEDGVIIALTMLGMLLALLDGFFYFIQGGSCIICFRYLRKKVKRSDGGECDKEQKKPCFQFITDKQRSTMNKWFQLIRTVLSEAILYPFAVVDILELISEGINYAQLKLFSIGFYVDLTSSVVTEGFADLVFHGEGIKTVKTQAKKATVESDVASVRDQFNNYGKNFTFVKRLLYRLTNPFAIMGSLWYSVLIVAFLFCHALTVNCDSGAVESILLQDAGVTVMFFIGLVFVLVANYQSVSLTCFALVILVLACAAILLLPVITIVLTPVILAAALVYIVVRLMKT